MSREVNRVEVFKNNNPNTKGLHSELQTQYVMIDIYRNYPFLLVMFLTIVLSRIPLRPTSAETNAGDTSNGIGMLNSFLSDFCIEKITGRFPVFCSLLQIKMA